MTAATPGWILVSWILPFVVGVAVGYFLRWWLVRRKEIRDDWGDS